jgi:uncharacterized protein (TIGR03382 family)
VSPLQWVRAAVTVAATAGIGAAQAVTLSDPSFDPAAYQVQVFAAPGQSITLSASASDGNPGAALQLDSTLPAPGPATALGRVLLFGGPMAYDPGASGAVGTLDWAMDKWVTILQPPGFGLANGVTLLLEQGGRYYLNGVALPNNQGAWFTGSASGLGASSFVELTDPANGVVDGTSHPDFSAGPMRFGLSASFGLPGGSPTLQILARYDNLSVTISPVPEPASGTLALAGAALLLVLARRRAAAPQGPNAPP